MMSLLFVESLRIVGREECLSHKQVLKVHIFMLVYKEAFYVYFVKLPRILLVFHSHTDEWLNEAWKDTERMSTEITNVVVHLQQL